MKKVLLFIILVLVLGFGAWVMKEPGEKPAERTTEKVSANRSPADQALVDSVLESPEKLDEPAGIPVASGQTEPVPLTAVTARPSQLLSSVEKPPLPRPLTEPVAAEKLYFWKDYESLRKDEIRNPDSAENRAGVVSLLQARQRRVQQNDL